MKILADENIEREIIEALRHANYAVLSVKESYTGTSDEKVLQIAENENAVILTYDKDFGELVFRYSLKSNGVVLLRISGLALIEKIRKTVEAILQHDAELENAFTVISESSVRIRKSF